MIDAVARPGSTLLAAWLLLAAAPTTAAVGGTGLAPELQVGVEYGLVTLQARDAPLREVLDTLARQAGFEVIGLEVANGTVTISLERVAVREALDRLVEGTSRVTVYAQEANTHGARAVRQVILLGSVTPAHGAAATRGSGNSAGDAPVHDGKARSEALLALAREEHAWRARAVFVESLREDADPLVRSRAAVALAEVGDASTVPTLEDALQDEHASVRVQVLGALARIGGDRAVDALGHVLLQGEGRRERLVAVMGLARQGTERAEHYLSAASDDSDASVRDAARRALADGGAARSVTSSSAERQGTEFLR